MNLTEILPPSVADDEKLFAVAKALDNALNYVQNNKNLVLLLPNLDDLPDDVLDHLATQYHCDFYDKNLAADVKRTMIRDSFAWHRIKGTPKAVQKILDMFMSNAYIEEWFDYGGEPFHFKIFAQSMRDLGDGDISFWRMLWDAKNVRSWLESITLELLPDELNLFHGIGEEIGGCDFTDLKLPDDTHSKLLHATGEICAGHDDIFIDFAQDIHADFYHATGALFADFELIDCDPTFLPDDTVSGDYLKLFFKFPRGNSRTITVPNPRENLQASEINNLGDFAADKAVILNSDGYATCGIFRAVTVLKQRIKVL